MHLNSVFMIFSKKSTSIDLPRSLTEFQIINIIFFFLNMSTTSPVSEDKHSNDEIKHISKSTPSSPVSLPEEVETSNYFNSSRVII